MTTAFEPSDSVADARREPAPPPSLLVASWPEPALLVRRDGHVLAASAAARRLLGAEGDAVGRLHELLGESSAEALLAAADPPRTAAPVERTVGDEGPAGTQPVLLARGVAVDGERVVVTLTDASGESRLRSHLDRAERLASVGELLSSVAHELNNPLTTVLGYADLLLSDEDPSRPQEELRRIRDAALRCRRIVGDLLNLARTDAVTMEPVAPAQVVAHVVEFRGYAATAAGISIEADPAPGCPAVLGDFHRLVQALLNLVTNAEDAVRAREAPRRIVVRSHAAGAGAALLVDDNGPGVPAALRPHVFQPFFTTKPRGRGTGLGLSLVRGTARAHGGDVRVEDSPLGGARFVIEIPAAL